MDYYNGPSPNVRGIDKKAVRHMDGLLAGSILDFQTAADFVSYLSSKSSHRK